MTVLLHSWEIPIHGPQREGKIGWSGHRASNPYSGVHEMADCANTRSIMMIYEIMYTQETVENTVNGDLPGQCKPLKSCCWYSWWSTMRRITVRVHGLLPGTRHSSFL